MIEATLLSAASGIATYVIDLLSALRKKAADREDAPLVDEARTLEQLSKTVMSTSVAVERRQGVSWATIGSVLGITRSSAHGRFADATPMDAGPSPEETLRQAWRKVLELAEAHLTPLVHHVRHLDANTRQETINRLDQVVLDVAVSAETRLSAAELSAALRGADSRQRVEDMLREVGAAANSPEDGTVFVGEADADNLMIDIAPALPIADEGDDRLLEKAIEAYRAALTVARERDTNPAQLYRLEIGLAMFLMSAFFYTRDLATLDEAIEIFRRAADFKTREGIVLRHKEVNPLGGLGAALQFRYQASGNRADLDEATQVAKYEVDWLSGLFGPEHPYTFKALDTFGTRLAELGKTESATHYLRKVVEGRTRVLGPDHADTLESRWHLARCLISAGEDESQEAGQLLEDLWAQQVRVLGADHPQTKETQMALLDNLTGRMASNPSLASKLFYITQTGGGALRQGLPATTASRLRAALFSIHQSQADDQPDDEEIQLESP